MKMVTFSYLYFLEIKNIFFFSGENQDLTRAHPDPFLRSMALWALKEYQTSLSTLLIGNAGTQHPAHDDEARETKEADPNVFNFYVYLRTHPLLVRQHLASSGQRKIWKDGKQIVAEDSITPLERQLYFATAHGHFRAGCPALALEVLSKLPNVVSDRHRITPCEFTFLFFTSEYLLLSENCSQTKIKLVIIIVIITHNHNI